jgi:hypothetical protein
METLDYKQIIKDEINFYLGHNNPNKTQGYFNIKDTPILYKLSLNYSKDQLKEVIGAIRNQIDHNFIVEGMIKGHFDIKKIERYKITYKNNIYNQDDYDNDIQWIRTVLKNIPLSTLKNSLPEDFIPLEKTPKGASATKGDWDDGTVFVHRNWGLGKKATGKDESNVNKNKLINKIKEKFDVLKIDIKIDFVGYKIERTLGKYKETIYEYNNS